MKRSNLVFFAEPLPRVFIGNAPARAVRMPEEGAWKPGLDRNEILRQEIKEASDCEAAGVEAESFPRSAGEPADRALTGEFLDPHAPASLKGRKFVPEKH